METVPPCGGIVRDDLYHVLAGCLISVSEAMYGFRGRLGWRCDQARCARDEAWLRSPSLSVASLLNRFLLRIMFAAVLSTCAFLRWCQGHVIESKLG